MHVKDCNYVPHVLSGSIARIIRMSLECGICPKCGHFVLLEDKPKGTRIGSYWSDSTLICNECKTWHPITLVKSGSVNDEKIIITDKGIINNIKPNLRVVE